MNATLVLLGGLLTQAQEAGGAAPRAYGEAPEGMSAFESMGQAYRWLFTEVPSYRGPGRDRPVNPALTEIRLGLIATLEGRGSEIGRSMRDGIILALEEANQDGGAHGLPFRLLERNDQGPWGASSNEMARLTLEDEVWAVFGSAEAASVHIALRVALKTRTPVISTGCSDPTLTETGIPWIVRTFPDDRQNAYRLAHTIYREQNQRRVAVVRVNDKYGRMGVQEFIEASVRLGRPPPLEIRFPPGETDFAAQIRRVAGSGADAVCFWGQAEEGGHFVRQLRQAGIDWPLYGCDLLVSPRFLELAGKAAEGAVLTTPWNREREGPRFARFQQAFQTRFVRPPDAFAAYGYDGARLVVAAIRSAGLNRPRIRDQLYEPSVFEGVVGTVQLDASRNNVTGVFLTRVEEGVFRAVW